MVFLLCASAHLVSDVDLVSSCSSFISFQDINSINVTPTMYIINFLNLSNFHCVGYYICFTIFFDYVFCDFCESKSRFSCFHI